jgi:hypothetical protein
MQPRFTFARALRVVAVAVTALAVAASAGTTRIAAAALPPGNTVAQWNQIAEDTVVGSGTFQTEGFIYMARSSRGDPRFPCPRRLVGIGR